MGLNRQRCQYAGKVLKFQYNKMILRESRCAVSLVKVQFYVSVYSQHRGSFNMLQFTLEKFLDIVALSL